MHHFNNARVELANGDSFQVSQATVLDSGVLVVVKAGGAVDRVFAPAAWLEVKAREALPR